MMTKVKRFTYLPIFLLAYYIIGSSTALDNNENLPQQQLLRTTPPAATMFIDHPNSSTLTQRNLQTTPPAATIDDTHPITDRDLRFKKTFFWAAGKSGKSGGGGSGHPLPRCHGSCKSHDDCMVSCL